MDERIKALLNACGMPNEELVEIYEDRNKSFYMQEFAELIVGECIRSCNEEEEEYRKLRFATSDFSEKNELVQGENAAARISIAIKKKFGVK